MTTNKDSKSRQTITLSVTFAVPDRPAQDHPGNSCRCTAPCKDNTLQQVGEIMFKTFTGQYSPQQEKGVAGVIEVLLRRHYTKTSNRKE